MQTRKCSICKKVSDNIFTVGLKRYCSPECGAILGLELHAKKASDRLKADRKELKARKDKLNETIPYWTKKAQIEFNKFIRLRDEKEPCISCGRFIDTDYLRGGNYDCGHYRSTGATPELRFDPMNAHKQCKQCNRDMSGNVVNYRINLIKRIGQENVDWIEGYHEPKRYRVQDLKLLHEQFKRLIKNLNA